VEVGSKEPQPNAHGSLLEYAKRLQILQEWVEDEALPKLARTLAKAVDFTTYQDLKLWAPRNYHQSSCVTREDLSREELADLCRALLQQTTCWILEFQEWRVRWTKPSQAALLQPGQRPWSMVDDLIRHLTEALAQVPPDEVAHSHAEAKYARHLVPCVQRAERALLQVDTDHGLLAVQACFAKLILTEEFAPPIQSTVAFHGLRRLHEGASELVLATADILHQCSADAAEWGHEVGWLRGDAELSAAKADFELTIATVEELGRCYDELMKGAVSRA
jgi:hypothetical protein